MSDHDNLVLAALAAPDRYVVKWVEPGDSDVAVEQSLTVREALALNARRAHDLGQSQRDSLEEFVAVRCATLEALR